MRASKDLGGPARPVRIAFRNLARLHLNNAVIIGHLVRAEGELLRELVLDPDRFTDVLHTLCAGPDESAEAFRRRLDPAALAAAAAAFLAAALAFCAGPRTGAAAVEHLDPRPGRLCAGV